MKIASTYFGFTVDFTNTNIASIIIENPDMLHKVLSDIKHEIDGFDGPIIISQDDKPISFSHNVESISDFIRFDLNRKTLISKLISKLNETAMDSENYIKSAELIQTIESFVDELQFGFDCQLNYSKLSVDSILKSLGIIFENEYTNDLERLIDYFGIVRELEHEKLFVLYNVKELFSYSNLEQFACTVNEKEYKILLIESIERFQLPGEKRFVIDTDLCEIY